MNDERYLELLAEKYPTEQAVSREIINLTAILSLPKGTEHFMSDLHGEYEAFCHILNNCSGVIREKVDLLFGETLSDFDREEICTLIYYPVEKLELVRKEGKNNEEWYRATLGELIDIARLLSSKYTRSKVRKAMPKEYAYILDELIHVQKDEDDNQVVYHRNILDTLLELDNADEFIEVLAGLIKRLAVDHLHIVGDIFDRGACADRIMDLLMQYHSLDIEWGNHDILWMGAAAGSVACMCNMLRISARYGNLSILEDAYGINMIPLMRLAMDCYQGHTSKTFNVHVRDDDEEYDRDFAELDAMMHKAITIIQFKAEGQLIKEHPEWDMQERLLLDKIDYEKGTIKLNGKEYTLNDTYFPTIDPKEPYKFTQQEEDVVERLKNSFLGSERLQRHIRFLYTKGSLYKVYNGNLLYHGCVPLNDDGSFMKVNIYGKTYSGKALYDILEHYARKGYYSIDPVEKKRGEDILWFIWKNKHSPVFGKERMATFERYFINEKETHEEPKNAYYRLFEKEEIVDKILKEFGLPVQGAHIINGHIPVIVKKGESPVKCGGKLLVIDGGFSKAYQQKTGIAGYTLIYNSYGLVLAAHEPFTSMEDTVLNETCIHSHIVMEQNVVKRKTVNDTDTGKVLRENIEELEELLEAYRSGMLVEKF